MLEYFITYMDNLPMDVLDEDGNKFCEVERFAYWRSYGGRAIVIQTDNNVMALIDLIREEDDEDIPLEDIPIFELHDGRAYRKKTMDFLSKEVKSNIELA